MNIFLLRHGEAESRISTDFKRQLTAKGRQDVVNVARQFLTRKLTLERCYASAYVRAQQTAELFTSVISETLEVETEVHLRPEFRAAQLVRFLGTLEQENVLLISHNPLLSELLALLTEATTSAMTDERLHMTPSQLVSLSIDIPATGMGSINFIINPEDKE